MLSVQSESHADITLKVPPVTTHLPEYVPSGQLSPAASAILSPLRTFDQVNHLQVQDRQSLPHLHNERSENVDAFADTQSSDSQSTTDQSSLVTELVNHTQT